MKLTTAKKNKRMKKTEILCKSMRISERKKKSKKHSNEYLKK